MLWSPLLAFAAGAITILSPCVLPLLPVILSTTVQEGAARPWGVVAGFVGSFTLATLALAYAVRSLGIPPDATRIISVVLLAAFGVILFVPRLKYWFETRTSGLVGGAASTSSGSGLVGGLAIGSSLGLAWTPCVGPIMASVITLALNQQVNAAALLTTLAFASGTAVPMAATIFGGRSLVRRLHWFQANGERIQRIFGALLIATAVAIYFGFDRSFQFMLLTWFPNWESALTGWEPLPR